MYCKQCGSSLDSSMKVCPNCGTFVEENSQIKKNNKKPTVIVLIIILFALLGCVAIYFGIHFISSPSNIVLSNISKMNGNISEMLDNSDNPLTVFVNNQKQLSLNSKYEITLDPKLNLGLEKLNLNLDYLDDSEQQKAQINFDLLIDDQQALSLNSLIKEDNLYFKLSDAMKNYYYTASEYFSAFQSLPTNDYRVFGDIIVSVMKKNIQDKDIVTENTTLKVFDQDVKVRKYIYTLTKERITKIFKDMIQEIKENESAMNILVEVTGATKEELLKELDNMSTQLETEISDDSVDFVTYVKGMNEVVATELSDEDTIIRYTDYDNQKEIRLIYEDEYAEKHEMYLDFKKVDNKWEFKGMILDVNVSGSITEQSEQAIFNLNVDSGTMQVKLDFTSQTKEVEKDSKYTSSMTGEVVLTSSGESITLGFNVDSTLSKGANINDDTTGAKNIDTLTEEEKLELQQQLMEVPLFSWIVNANSGMIS